MHTHMFTYEQNIYIYRYMYVYIYICIERERERERERSLRVISKEGAALRPYQIMSRYF